MVRSPVVFITVGLTGGLSGGDPPPPMLRSTAQIGDQVAVTGPLGGSGGGLKLMLENPDLHAEMPEESARYLRQSHRRPKPEVPAGRLTRAVLEAQGQSALLDSVVSEEDNVRAVLTKVAVGEADAGYVYASDARSAGDDVRTFALAGGLRNRYLAAPLAGAREPSLAARFVAFLREPFVQGLLRQAGFEPGLDIGGGPDAGS